MTDIEVGKFTLESLTTGMYSEPKIIYREYIQNSVDSLDDALRKKIVQKQEMRIDVIVDAENRRITIIDNGTGLSSDNAASILLNIGSSGKRQNNNRGFRGIGRLGGMSYCNSLVFETSCMGENKKTRVEFDCQKLRELLVPGKYEQYNLSKVIEAITSIQYDSEISESHYFRVVMDEVSDFSDLLDVKAVRTYISQVGPVGYDKEHFFYASDIRKYMKEHGYIIDEYPIYVGEDIDSLIPVSKPVRYRFHSDRKKMKEDVISGIRYFEINIDERQYAIGWYADCDWLGTISETVLSGLRVRKGNILIGDSRTLNSIFKNEHRFNGWVQGEVFITTDELIPNARRDDFEQNESYYKFIECMKDEIGSEIIKKIRTASGQRNDASAKVIRDAEQAIRNAEKELGEGFNSSVDKNRILKQLSQEESSLQNAKVRQDLQEKRDALVQKIREMHEKVNESNNYKVNKIKSGIDRKSKKILAVVSDVLSEKLSKFLVDDILDEVVDKLNGKQGKV